MLLYRYKFITRIFAVRGGKYSVWSRFVLFLTGIAVEKSDLYLLLAMERNSVYMFSIIKEF